MTRSISLPEPASRVIEEVPGFGMLPSNAAIGNIIISIASAAETIAPWGSPERDVELRAFWPTEPFFASGLFNTIAQYVAFGWTLEGPKSTVQIVQNMLNNCQMGGGYQELMSRVLVDYFTQDNGAFIEVVRTDDDPRAPVVSLNHLDARRCIRTGRHEKPIYYIDIKGRYHEMAWYNVMSLTEMPSPLEEARGMQYCVLTRMLRSAQIMSDIAILKHEKASGRFTRQIHLVGGIQTKVINDAMQQKQMAATASGLARYVQPVVIGSLDPTATVKLETINLADIPDDWDEQKSVETYVLLMAMAFGSDYQNFAPLPGGGLGSGSQSKVMNMKSRGKGPGLFMKKMEALLNFHGAMPRSVSLKYGDQDTAEQMEQTAVRKERALTRQIMIESGEITTEVARQMAVDDGDMPEAYLTMMRESNATETIVAASTEPVDMMSDEAKPGAAGPKEPPGGKPPAAPNSNNERNRNPATNQKRNPGGTPEGGAAA